MGRAARRSERQQVGIEMASGVRTKTQDWRGALARRVSERDGGPGLIAWVETSLIVLGLLGQFFLLPHILDADGKARYQELDALLRGALTDSKYSLVGPLFAAPLWLVGAIFGDTVWWVARFNTLFLGLGLLALYLLLRDRMDRRALRAFLLLLLVASMFPAHVEGFYGEVFT